jgi:hypothetical protein
MISSCMMRNPIIFNKSLQDYCKKINEESIRKLSDGYNLEKNKPKIKNLLKNDDSNNPDYNYFGIIIILSITMFTFSFYKRLQ